MILIAKNPPKQDDGEGVGPGTQPTQNPAWVPQPGFAQYGNPELLYAINGDGSDVTGFPFDIAEKVQRGVAVADFNNNGKSDIVFGTDSDNIYLMLDDGSIANGFPFSAQDKVQSSPAILDINIK